MACGSVYPAARTQARNGEAIVSRAPIEMLGRLAELGADEVRCYAAAAPSHTARQEATAALREMIPES
ncbi:MAG: hypothetical protein R8G01_12810 [Ilumatobacteraceae bacterium]|nr:hypothetical protein [Ilumatobacteraceae bacterium]